MANACTGLLLRMEYRSTSPLSTSVARMLPITVPFAEFSFTLSADKGSKTGASFSSSIEISIVCKLDVLEPSETDSVRVYKLVDSKFRSVTSEIVRRPVVALRLKTLSELPDTIVQFRRAPRPSASVAATSPTTVPLVTSSETLNC